MKNLTVSTKPIDNHTIRLIITIHQQTGTFEQKAIFTEFTRTQIEMSIRLMTCTSTGLK